MPSSRQDATLTPDAVLALDASPKSVNRPAQLPLQKPSPATPAGALEGRSSGSASTPEPLPPPRRSASPTPAKSDHPRAEAPEYLCVCYEALAAPMVYLDSCSHQLHLPCYSALRIRTAAGLRCPTCTATVTIKEAGRRALQQHSEEFIAEAMAVSRRAMPARRGGGGSPIRATRNGSGG